MNHKFKLENSILYRFVISFIAILISALLIGFIVHQKTVKIIENEMKSTTLGILEQTKGIIDMRLEEVELIVRQLETNPKVRQFEDIYQPFGENTYKIIDTKKALYDYSISNQFIFNYYLLFNNSNIVMNDKYVDTLESFHTNILSLSDVNDDQWYKDIFKEHYQKKYFPVRDYIYKGKNNSFVTYIDTIGTPNNYQTAIMVLIDSTNILHLLNGVDTSNDGWVYITDKEGQIIISESDNKETPTLLDVDEDKGVIEKMIDSKNMMVTYTTSDYNGWTYVAAQSPNIVLEKVNYINKITLVIMFIALLIGLIISFYLAHHHAKPVKRIFLNNEELQKKISEQKPFMKNVVFEQLLKGEINTPKEIKMLTQHVGIDLKGKNFILILLYLQKPEGIYSEEEFRKLDVKRIIAKNTLHHFIGKMGYIHDVKEDKIALLLKFNSEDQKAFQAKIKEIVKQIRDDLYSTHQINHVIAIGNIYQDIMDISQSYEEANHALNYKIFERQNDEIWYEDLQKDGNHAYYYPSDVELRLTNIAKSGNEKRTVELLNELYHINFEERKLSLYMLSFFLYEMWGSIVKLLDQVVIEDTKTYQFIESTAFGLDSIEDIEASYQDMIDTYRRICKHINQQKANGNTRLIKEIIKYINHKFTHPDLSLTMISKEFNITEAYLSRLFKEHHTFNLSEYIENARMEKAEELLITTDLSVGRIGKEVGYLSINSFGRAFKRKNGITATEYRNTAKITE